MPALTMGPSRPWRFPGGMLAFSRAWSAVEVMPAVDIPRKGDAGALHAHSAREHGTHPPPGPGFWGRARAEDKRPGVLSPTSAESGTEPLESQGAVDFSVTIRLASRPGFYWTDDRGRHPKRLVQYPVVRLGCRTATNPQNSVLVGRQNDRRDLVSRQQVANRRP